MNALGLDEQHELLKIVIERLERCGIAHMVAGAVAANRYMVARSTNDIDIVIKTQEGDIDKLLAAFAGDFYFNSHEAIQEALKALSVQCNISRHCGQSGFGADQARSFCANRV